MWTFALPTRVTFGEQASAALRETAASHGRSPILVTDAGLSALPVFRELAERMPDIPIFSEVEPNPTVRNVDALAGQIRRDGHDALVAVGGGSALDCAKAASALAVTEAATIRRYHSEGKKLGPRHLPVIAVPTTAGTGSEVTPFAVLNDTEKGVKGPMAGEALYPVHAVVDPELTYSLPKTVTAATGLDALCHAIEGYWSKGHQPVCDLLAEEAAARVFANLGQALAEPGNHEARRAMSYAALLAGMAFQAPKNAMVHACSFPLSSRFHLPHGAACAFTLEFALRLNAPHMSGRLERLAERCGFDTIEDMARAVRDLKALGGLPHTLREAGIPPDAVETLISESFHPLMRNNPKEVTPEDLRRMYAELA